MGKSKRQNRKSFGEAPLQSGVFVQTGTDQTDKRPEECDTTLEDFDMAVSIVEDSVPRFRLHVERCRSCDDQRSLDWLFKTDS